ncbi:hypothetical protein [Luteimonas sp. SDU82]|uniref:hypothetical protein n=1 Tax=Luteimonas sp. SDU82 TaxID=3422592 RepID=UPI003EB78D22
MSGDFRIALRREAGELQAHVTGSNTRANTFGYWRAIAEALEAQRAGLLLLVDELEGPPLDAADWRALVAEFGPLLGRLRVAHVKPRGLDTVEHCMLSAIGSGLEAQVFADVHSAALWLRYGQQRDSSGDR